jgi:hypothetical protein
LQAILNELANAKIIFFQYKVQGTYFETAILTKEKAAMQIKSV